MNTRPYRPRLFRVEPRTVVITARQANCLDGLCDGLSNPQIAKRFHITEDTVKSHVRQLLHRLGATNRAHAVGLVLTGRVTVLVRDHGQREAA